MAEIAVTNQWNDFLVRQVDPYAASKYEILLAWLGQVTNEEILVIGSGSGELAALLARAGAKVTAFDISEQCVELTRQTAKKFEVNIECSVASIESYSTSKKFSVVLATDVIEHIEDDNFALQKMRDLLSPGGCLVITVPALQALFGYHDEALGHYRRYSKAQLNGLVSGMFEVERIRYYGFLLIPVALVISKLLRVPYPVQEVGERGQGSGLAAYLIRFVFGIEKYIPPPLGTSLLLLAKRG